MADGSAPAAPAAAPAQAPSQTQPGQAPAAPAPEAPDFVEVKINGKVERLSAADVARLRKEAAAERKWHEAKRFSDEAAQKLERLKSDPWAILQEHGLNPDELAEKRILERLQREQLTPEQRQLEQERAKREELEKKLQEREAAEHQARVDAAAKRYMADFSTRAEAALVKAGFALKDAQPGDRRVAWAVSAMARYEQLSGGQATPEELAQVVLEDADGHVSGRLSSMEPEAAVDYLERLQPGLARKVARVVAQRLQQTAAAPAPRPTAPASPARAPNGRYEKSTPGPSGWDARAGWRK